MNKLRTLKKELCEKRGEALVGYATSLLYSVAGVPTTICVTAPSLANLGRYCDSIGVNFNKPRAYRVAIFKHPKTKPRPGAKR